MVTGTVPAQDQASKEFHHGLGEAHETLRLAAAVLAIDGSWAV